MNSEIDRREDKSDQEQTWEKYDAVDNKKRKTTTIMMMKEMTLTLTR